MFRKPNKDRFKQFSEKSYFVALWACAVLVGCNSNTQIICSEYLPQARRETQNALTSLHPWTSTVPGRDGRGLASQKEQAPRFSERDRRTWQNWTDTRIQQTETIKEVLTEESPKHPLRPLLNTIGNDLVFLHGYAGQGDAIGVARTLTKLEEKVTTLEQKLCAKP